MRFEHYITEVFTTKVPIRVTWSGDNAWNVKFEADEETYEVYFSRLMVGNLYSEKAKINPNTWEVNFQEMGYAHPQNFPSAFKVFSGVIAAFKKFIKEKKPNIIVFDPSSAQLKKIYDRFVKPIEKMGFKRRKGADEISRLAHFVFVRKGYEI